MSWHFSQVLLDLLAKNAKLTVCPRRVPTANKNSMNPTSTNARTGRSGHGAKSAIGSSPRTITPRIPDSLERKQRRGENRMRIELKNIALPIAKSPIGRRSSGNTVFRLIGSMAKWPSRKESVWDANVNSSGQTSRTRRTLITAINLERFAGYCATDATRSSGYAKTQLQFSNLSSAT